MASTKLYYFDTRGRGECLRLILAASGKPWEDVRFPRDKWPEYKPKAPFGQAPFLEYNGKFYGQTIAIASFLAREFGFAGKTNVDALCVDQVVQLQQEFVNVLVKVFFGEKDETKKAELKKKLVDEDIPKFFKMWSQLLKDNGSTGHFVGKALSLADIMVYDVVKGLAEPLKAEEPMDKGYPELEALRTKVEANANIKKYMDKRAAAK